MVRELRFLVPGTVTYINNSSATVANGQKIEIVAVGQLRNCKLALYIPSLVQNLCSPSHMRRDGDFPGQIGAETECINENGAMIDTVAVRQYHYQTADVNEQILAPYQILARARAEGNGLYSMPSSWLEMQPHLLSQGEVDPHEFVGRDDRPINMRSYYPISIDSVTFGEVAHNVREAGISPRLQPVCAKVGLYAEIIYLIPN